MAEEKEERITIVRLFKGECCPLYDKWHDECAEFADRQGTSHCEKCSVGMTRQEAIERMAKAIYDFEIVACSHKECGNKQCENCETWKWCEHAAEAALNAIIKKS